jgi:hypothetical protein
LLVRHRLFRVLVFLLAGWPLLMPPGMCICQFVRAGEPIPRSSGWEGAEAAESQAVEGQDEDCCPDPCCVRDKANRGPCRDEGKGAPAKPACPASCPAGGNARHFQLVEHQHLPGLSAASLSPLPFSVVPQGGEALPDLHTPSPPPVLPLYLSLCTLLI